LSPNAPYNITDKHRILEKKESCLVFRGVFRYLCALEKPGAISNKEPGEILSLNIQIFVSTWQ